MEVSYYTHILLWYYGLANKKIKKQNGEIN